MSEGNQASAAELQERLREQMVNLKAIDEKLLARRWTLLQLAVDLPVRDYDVLDPVIATMLDQLTDAYKTQTLLLMTMRGILPEEESIRTHL